MTVEIVYALVSSAVVGAAVGLVVYLTARLVGLGDVAALDTVDIGLALILWAVRTFVVLRRFDREVRRSDAQSCSSAAVTR